MADFNAINENLNSVESSTVQVNLVTLGGVSTSEVTYGMTISEFKTRNGLGDAKIANAEGDILSGSDIITEDMELYISTPKKNG